MPTESINWEAETSKIRELIGKRMSGEIGATKFMFCVELVLWGQGTGSFDFGGVGHATDEDMQAVLAQSDESLQASFERWAGDYEDWFWSVGNQAESPKLLSYLTGVSHATP